MSEYAEEHRRSAKAKAKRLAEGKVEGKVDASDYGPPSQESFDKQTSHLKPKARAYKAGGKVEGEEGSKHAGKRPRRAAGGRVAPIQAMPFHGNGLAPRIGNPKPVGIAPVGVSSQHPGMNLPLARKSGGRTGRDTGGEVPTQRMNFTGSEPGEMARAGGLKTGGRTKRADGGSAMGLLPDAVMKKPTGAIGAVGLKTGGRAKGDSKWIEKADKHPGALHRELDVPKGKKIPEKKLEKAEHSSNPKERKRADFAKELGGMREGRATGGRAKGKTNINIVIAQPHSGAAPAADPTQAPPAPKPMNMPVPTPPTAAPPPAGAAPMPMPNQFPMGGAGGQSPGGPLPRKRGGAV